MRPRRFMRLDLLAALGLAAAAVTTGAELGVAQHQHGAPEATGAPTPASPPSGGARAPRRVTMDELHASGGVPRGWKFTVPPGDPGKGRQLFADLECYKCHVIKGELLPAPSPDPKHIGPELTGMGGEHPAEFIAESILAPNHVIVDGPGYSGPDGLSTMPSFVDSLSLTQWLDLVAYLKSLTGTGDAPHGPAVEREQTAGDYRIRLVYHRPNAGAEKSSPGRLSIFVLDREVDEPVPYLPVSVAVQAERRPTERLRLVPTMDEHGFHYGLHLTLPPRTQKITVTIGTTTLQLAGAAKGKFTKPVSVIFDWANVPR